MSRDLRIESLVSTKTCDSYWSKAQPAAAIISTIHWYREMPAYQGPGIERHQSRRRFGHETESDATRVTETAKLLSCPQMVQAYEDVGNFVHQHSHQSATALQLPDHVRIPHEFELCSRATQSSAILSDDRPFRAADLLRRFLTSTLKAPRHRSILRCDILLVHRCGK